MEKVKIESIVFLQGDDYTQACMELDPDYDPEGYIAAWIDDSKLIDYMLQWYYPGEHDTNIYNAEDVNTEFLGHEIQIDDNLFLFSHNTGIGYAGLSRIIKYFND
jgi:hypothetical protein